MLVLPHDGGTRDPLLAGPLWRSGQTRRACYSDDLSGCAAPSSRVGGARDVLTWIVLGLTVWLAIGVLTARLLGVMVGDEDDQDLTTGSCA